MAQALTETAAEETAADECASVIAWRWEQLLEGGYSPLRSRTLAHRMDIDLHLALDLLSQGCDEQTAFEILR